MTTAPNNPTDVEILGHQVGSDNANAIATFVDGRIAAAFVENDRRLADLEQRVVDLHGVAGNQPAVTEAAQAVRNATVAHNDHLTHPSEATAAADTASTQQAAQAVEQAEQELGTGQADGSQELPATEPEPVQPPAAIQVDEVLAGRVRELEIQGERHERILCIDRVGDRPQSRLDNMDTQLRLTSRASANALAIARAAGGDGRRLEFASRIALATFGVIALLYLVFAVLTSLDWTLRNQFAWPFGFGAVAFWLGLVFWPDNNDQQATAEARAEASTRQDARRQRGRSIRGTDANPPQRPARAQRPASAQPVRTQPLHTDDLEDGPIWQGRETRASAAASAHADA
jgi:hypothetical protein